MTIGNSITERLSSNDISKALLNGKMFTGVMILHFLLSTLVISGLTLYTIRKINEDQSYATQTNKNVLMFLMSFVGLSGVVNFLALVMRYASLWSTKTGIYMSLKMPLLFKFCIASNLATYHYALCVAILLIRYSFMKRNTF